MRNSPRGSKSSPSSGKITESRFELEVQPKARQYLERVASINPGEAARCWVALNALRENPFRRRPGVDIGPWKGPQFDYRLRVGRHRLGYTVGKKERVVSVDYAWFK